MNCVTLMGRLTRDPEIKRTSSGKSYCRFSIAVKKEFVKDGADFINCIAWDKKAETIEKYFSKGHRIIIQGRLSVNTYEVEGEKRYSTDVLVDKIDFVENLNSGQSYDRSYTSAEAEVDSDFIDDDSDDDAYYPF